MELHLSDFNQLLLNYLLPLFRILGMLMAMPIIGTRLVPTKIKLGIGLALTLAIAPTITINQSFEIFSVIGILIAINQIFIGIVFGLLVHVIFQAFLLTGQVVAMQMGLGFAQMVDPQNGVSVPAVGQIYLMMVTLLFLSVNGHLIMINIMGQSFQSIPVGSASITFNSVESVVGWGGWMFSGALKMALPAISALFVINIAFGVMTKAAPQLNIFTIGFPTTMILGVIILWFTLGTVLPNFELIVDKTVNKIRAVALLEASDE